MKTLQELKAERDAIEANIVAMKPQAIEQVRQVMKAMGVTVEDLTGKKAYRSHRPVKYRDGANTWTGVGQRPRWLRAHLEAGADIEQFRAR